MLGKMEIAYGLIWAFVYLCIVNVCGQYNNDIQGTEYCEGEAFQKTCAEDEVILITKAEYGRMRIGRCMQTDFGYVGCRGDVLDLADERCSGRRECKIAVPDVIFDKKAPCHELKSYLELSYECVPVAIKPKEICSNAKYVKVTSSTGYLASNVTYRTGCGTALCPWVLEVPKGQRIKLTLFNFSRRKTSYKVLASLREMSDSESVRMYNHLSERSVEAYVSKSNQVEIAFLDHRNVNFLFKYEAIGCADIESPINGEFIRVNETEATINCLYSSYVYILHCKGDSWKGPIHNCTTGKLQTRDFNSRALIPHGVAIAIVAGVAIIIGMLILTVGLVIFKSNQYSQNTTPRPLPEVTIPPKSAEDPRYYHDPPRYDHESTYTELPCATPRMTPRVYPVMRMDTYGRTIAPVTYCPSCATLEHPHMMLREDEEARRSHGVLECHLDDDHHLDYITPGDGVHYKVYGTPITKQVPTLPRGHGVRNEYTNVMDRPLPDPQDHRYRKEYGDVGVI